MSKAPTKTGTTAAPLSPSNAPVPGMIQAPASQQQGQATGNSLPNAPSLQRPASGAAPLSGQASAPASASASGTGNLSASTPSSQQGARPATGTGPSSASTTAPSAGPPSGSSMSAGASAAASPVASVVPPAQTSNDNASKDKAYLVPAALLFHQKVTFYHIGGEHRGDMYHVRASRALDTTPIPLIIYGCKFSPLSASAAAGSRNVDLGSMNEVEQYLCTSRDWPFARTSADQTWYQGDAVTPLSAFKLGVEDRALMPNIKSEPNVPKRTGDFVAFQSYESITESECTNRVRDRFKTLTQGANKEDTDGDIAQALDSLKYAMIGRLAELKRPADEIEKVVADGEKAAKDSVDQVKKEAAKKAAEAAEQKLRTKYAEQVTEWAKIKKWLCDKLPEVFLGIVNDGQNAAKQAAKGERVVLIMHRTTGTGWDGTYGQPVPANAKLGVYPENDCTTQCCEQLAKVIKSPVENKNKEKVEFKWDDDTPIKTMRCGDKASGPSSIGEYWLKLKLSEEEKKAAGDAGSIAYILQKYEVSPRHIEALFMLLAHETDYIRMVVGYRSGALDMFTFLGIPTVSLQLAKLRGHDRMNKLSPVPANPSAGPAAQSQAKPDLSVAAPYKLGKKVEFVDSTFEFQKYYNVFRRLNVNYETSRHSCTQKRKMSAPGARKGEDAFEMVSPSWFMRDQYEPDSKLDAVNEAKAKEAPNLLQPADEAKVKSAIQHFMLSAAFPINPSKRASKDKGVHQGKDAASSASASASVVGSGGKSSNSSSSAGGSGGSGSASGQPNSGSSGPAVIAAKSPTSGQVPASGPNTKVPAPDSRGSTK
ncbi:hypothetical protein OC846_004168 [Tilletia horrida]|uniref:Uncharacterized protein n=1 Tax=Tilletia horrida TaxID=155126 RepID=A0AAN6GN42_9BASI|nr:hypothetical protein OC846_004168 [Tilletia horrida]KAK0569608.1 hypothetical protein OC861_000788 [Tilletia horrida]